MAKRFTDTEKWRDPWFDGLSLSHKLLWLYLCDVCDGAGIWKVSLRHAQLEIGEHYTIESLKTLGRRLVWISDEKIWIPGFIPFQYGNLSGNNRAHIGIMRKIVALTDALPLDKNNRKLIDKFKTLVGGQPTPQEEEKEKEEVKEKIVLGESEGIPFKPRTASRIKSAGDLAEAIPLIARDRYAKAYPDPVWVTKQIEACYHLHIADPTKCPTTDGQWMRKLESWLLNEWPKRAREKTNVIDWSEVTK